MRILVFLGVASLASLAEAGEILSIDPPNPMAISDAPQDLVIRTDGDFGSAVSLQLTLCTPSGACDRDWLRFHTIPSDGVFVWTGALYCMQAGDHAVTLTLDAKRPVQSHARDLTLVCQ